MDIKKYIKHIKKINKVSPFILLAIGFVVGVIVMFLYFQPKLAYQEKTARDFANVANKNQTLASQNKKEAVSYKVQLASASAEITSLLNKPAQVIYKTNTQYVQEPASPQTVTYHDYGGFVEGSNGSTCYNYGYGLVCSGGH